MERDLEFERLKEIQHRHQSDLLAIPGVLGVGISAEDGDYGFVVLVRAGLDAEAKIQATLEGIPVRIVHVKEIVAHETTRPEGFTSA
ncbi:MAG: hypothetical protein HY650_04470 [Acidobacteria bacterium]|nr:hypothetical protein [Acidobacteriota bacterium]